MGVITFNGIASDKLGIQVEHPPGYETPKKDYEIVHVPGRNGDVYIDTITAIDTFLGVILGISTLQYNKNESGK